MVSSHPVFRADRREGAFGAAQAAGASGRDFLVDFRAYVSPLYHAAHCSSANTARSGLRFCGSSLAMVSSHPVCRADRSEGAFGAAQAAGASSRDFLLVDFRA